MVKTKAKKRRTKISPKKENLSFSSRNISQTNKKIHSENLKHALIEVVNVIRRAKRSLKEKAHLPTEKLSHKKIYPFKEKIYKPPPNKK